MEKFAKTRYSLGCLLLAIAQTALAASPAEQEVERQAQKLVRQRLADAGLDQPDIRLQLLPPRDLPAACASPWQADATDSRAFSRMRFDLRCPASGWRGAVIVRAAVGARVAVAARGLRAGEPLREEDIAWANRPVSDPADLFGAAAPPQGLASRAAIADGQPLRRRQLQAPLLVKRGAEARIVARQDGVEVNAAGEALDNGHQGETIRVRNLSSGKVIRGRVGPGGEIEPLD
ncbi:flagellar basal body P-ring formation chaperone FlgA [Chromobacterium vaccinii]|uniref:flagellar basal body P-ring formation chaperone FlgA n=2 Tax=Chromobacterium vaccinii TaxID=1108595 RepID=UPI0031D20376